MIKELRLHFNWSFSKVIIRYRKYFENNLNKIKINVAEYIAIRNKRIFIPFCEYLLDFELLLYSKLSIN